ncbi:hypothetical protein ACQFG6_003027 [Klebsiella michiganensis]|jgi:hypothetical protein|uniref:hypothetical protein n=1 Tax=Klebsiella michiganensis TaxID=1134687 RepID=UPI001CCA108A|nr:hypothetical protein [Klebsiella michiganensis]DAI63447.1 MAG TPA: hypothetical protein [Caudoviricetes sp.]HEE0701251.1 hypothetical protein [Klebsiella pneumoniae]ELT9740111.1 hypothetical protein [Klebsiella michiganensis]MBZ7422110.1 hypothetical protein [Klebsiella michiganensis]MBZ7767668.1 hypothetical protein [Klebsiella michiganensis]
MPLTEREQALTAENEYYRTRAIERNLGIFSIVLLIGVIFNFIFYPTDNIILSVIFGGVLCGYLVALDKRVKHQKLLDNICINHFSKPYKAAIIEFSDFFRQKTGSPSTWI